MLSRWLFLVALTFLACGRNPMEIPARDGAPIVHPKDLAIADAKSDATEMPDTPEAADVVWNAGPDLARDLALTVADGPALSFAVDACVPLVCQDPSCFPAYCGEIGDGCGGTLHCGDCAAGWSCKAGQCFPDDCVPIACDNESPFPYCGVIGDGCGGTLECTCPKFASTCIDHVCNGVASGCVPIPACVNSWGDEYCGGMIGDGCGGVLDCRRECSREGFVCRSNVCVDARDAGPPQPSVPPPPPSIPPPPPVPPPPPPPPCPPPPRPPAPNR